MPFKAEARTIVERGRSSACDRRFASHDDLRGALEERAIGVVPGRDERRHRRRVQSSGGDKVENLGNMPMRVADAGAKTCAVQVHLHQRDRRPGSGINAYARADATGLEGAKCEFESPAERVRRSVDADAISARQWLVASSKERARDLYRPHTESCGDLQSCRTRVDIVDFARAQGLGNGCRVKADAAGRATDDEHGRFRPPAQRGPYASKGVGQIVDY